MKKKKVINDKIEEEIKAQFAILERLKKATSIQSELIEQWKELEDRGELINYLNENKIIGIKVVSSKRKPLEIKSQKLINDYIKFCNSFYQNTATKIPKKKMLSEFTTVVIAGYSNIKKLIDLKVSHQDLADYFNVDIESFRKTLNRAKERKEKWTIKK